MPLLKTGLGRVSGLDYAQRWLRDGLHVIHSAGGLGSQLFDMTGCALLIQELRQQHIAMTYTPIVVAAAARALARHPNIHRLISGRKQIIGGPVDICLSIAGDAVVTPVVIIRNAGEKDLFEISKEIKEEAPRAREESEKLQVLLRRWGWVLPFSFLRRAFLRMLLDQLGYRRRVSGTFQISMLPVDLFVPLIFNTAGALGMGAVLKRPINVDGRIENRLTAYFSCAIDHTQWNGVEALTFIRELKTIIEDEVSTLAPSASFVQTGA